MLKQSEQTNELDAALVSFQLEMPAIGRDKEVSMKGKSKAGNEYTVNYDYAPLEAIQKIAKPKLAKNGLTVRQMLSCIILKVNGNDVIQEGIVTKISHKSGQFCEAFWPLFLDKIEKEQDRGSKITFNKRYAYTGALDIELSDEDTDAVDVKATPKKNLAKQTNLQGADSLADYKIANGTLKGKALKSLSLDEVQTFLTKSEKYFQEQGKSPYGSFKDDMNNAYNYLCEQAELKGLPA